MKISQRSAKGLSASSSHFRMAQKTSAVKKEDDPYTSPSTALYQKESQKVLLQMKETLNDNKDLSLLEIFKKKEQIKVRTGDFDIDCVLDE